MKNKEMQTCEENLKRIVFAIDYESKRVSVLKKISKAHKAEVMEGCLDFNCGIIRSSPFPPGARKVFCPTCQAIIKKYEEAGV